MPDTAVRKQAETVVGVMPRLLRKFFSLDLSDPSVQLPVAQVRVCAALGDRPRNMSCISKELGISLSATTQIADRLEKAGLVERCPNDDDRRAKSLRLTKKGEDIMRARWEMRVERTVTALELLSPEEREVVMTSLRDLSEICRTIEERRVGVSCDSELSDREQVL